MYYGNSLNWRQAIHVTDYEALGETVSVGMAQDALGIDSTGTIHIVWYLKFSSPEENDNGVSDDGEIYYTTLGKEEPVGGDTLPINTLAFITPIIRLAIALYSARALCVEKKVGSIFISGLQLSPGYQNLYDKFIFVKTFIIRLYHQRKGIKQSSNHVQTGYLR